MLIFDWVVDEDDDDEADDEVVFGTIYIVLMQLAKISLKLNFDMRFDILIENWFYLFIFVLAGSNFSFAWM